MKKSLSSRKVILIAMAAVLVAGVLALAGCSCGQEPAKDTSQTSQASDTTYTVPNVVSLTQSDAKKAISAAGFQVGKVTKKASDTVPLGHVISQDPAAHTKAKPNSKVNLVVSSGKTDAKDVKVPDLKGMTQAEAEKALKDAGLVGVASNPEETDQVEPGKVFKQSIAAGETVKEGTKVAFTVALAPGEATVPGVIGMTQEDARKAILDAKLGFDTTTSYSDGVAEGNVISQSIAAGTKVKQGTTVSVTISLGPKPSEDVTVPDVTTYTWSDAEAALHSAGLAARYTGDPSGVVVSQDVAPGTKVAPNTLVTVTLQAQIRQVAVPNIVGMSVNAAQQAVNAVGLTLDPDGDDGTVTSQSPAAGTMVDTGTTVSATVESHDTEVIERFLGSWTEANQVRVKMEFQNIGSGITVKINASNGANDSVSWEYQVAVEGNNLVCKSGGKKYTNSGGSSQLERDDLTATFSIGSDGYLTWKDDQEDAGKDFKFEKM